LLAFGAVWLASRLARAKSLEHLGATLIFGCALTLPLLAQARAWATAWPWFAPIGCLTAFAFGYLLARPNRAAHSESPR
jgi:hypothetical protein